LIKPQTHQQIKTLIGPFKQLLTMAGLPLKGALQDQQLQIIKDAGILTANGNIEKIAPFSEVHQEVKTSGCTIHAIDQPLVALPGFIDVHTHICYDGSRAGEYALRMAGKSYLEIARAEGGIWYTVKQTRAATAESLSAKLMERTRLQLNRGITTIEVKSGYGLTVEDELKMLTVINRVNQQVETDLVATCLAAHTTPEEFRNAPDAYLQTMTKDLFPLLKTHTLTNRIDVYIDQGAFTFDQGRRYLAEAQKMGFDLTVHADQFSTGGSKLAVQFDAKSADHLEASGKREIERLARSDVIPVALPGASVGLGMAFAPARKLLDAGASLAIASDWNPGSAPMGDLLVLAAVIGIYEKLTSAEILAALTCRAAAALDLQDRGQLAGGCLADIIAFPCDDYREILYHQGTLKPEMAWKKGKRVK
jgi:imidazolonepropionase